MRIELGKINQSWGKQGENNSVELAVDVSAWKAEYPSGAPSAAYTRADGFNYVLPVVIDGNYAVCTLSRTETACAGVVRLQISWIQGELVAKTALFEGYIELGIVDDEEVLDSPEETVLEQMQQYAAATAASASAAASSASAAQAAQTEAEAAQDAAEDAQSAAEAAQGKAEAAQAAAETAQANAETARTQAQEAQNAAVTAQGKAEDAQEAAEAAQAAAEGAAEDLAEAVASAAQSASSAAQSATYASGYASAASSSATAAAGSATTAQGHASAAQTARADAESAQSAAVTAQGLAEDAQDAAETARNGAQSAQSAAESAKSGAEAAKSGAETAKAAAETAAGNASDHAEAAASSASAAAQSAQTAQNAAQTALEIIDDGVVAKDSTWSSKQIIDALCPPIEATGNPVQCYPVAGYPLGVKVSWEPQQEGEGDPSPDNVRPIVGRNSVNVQHTGKNLLDKQAFMVGYYIAQDGVAYRNSVNAASDFVWLANGYSYVISSFADVNNIGICLYNTDKQTVLSRSNNYSTSSVTIEPSNYDRYLRIWVDFDASTEAEIWIKTINLQIELGSTATDYEPYTGTTATLPLPSTVYGGEVDVATGEGVETWKSYELDSDNVVAGIVDANGNDTSNLFYVGYIDGVMLDDQYSADTIVCTHLKYRAIVSQTETGNGISGNPNGSLVYFRLNREIADSTQEFLDWLVAQAAAGTPVTIAYKLATPQPITATGGQQIAALAGVNTVMTDADGVTVTGRADPVATVQALTERVAALEAETIGGNQT